MAIWQYDLIAVPRRSLLAVFTDLPKEIQPEVFDNHNWWRGVNIPSEQELLALLPKSSSWSTSIKAWGGDSDGHRLELHYDNGVLFELKIRIDLRGLDKQFLDAVLQLAARHGCVLWTEEGLLLEPNFRTVLQDIAKSRAFSFVRNPTEFLDQMSRAENS